MALFFVDDIFIILSAFGLCSLILCFLWCIIICLWLCSVLRWCMFICNCKNNDRVGRGNLGVELHGQNSGFLKNFLKKKKNIVFA